MGELVQSDHPDRPVAGGLAEGASQGEATRSSIDTASPDAPSLLRPSLQKIVTELSGYSKHKKVSEDVGALVERLDVLLVTVGGPGTGRGPARGAGGGLSSPKAFRDSMRVAPVGGEERGLDRDASSHSSTSEEFVEVGIEYESSGHQQEPGALADGAARELMLVLHDAIMTRVPRVMEAALDCLQKLISFSLIRGSVFSINHKGASPSGAGLLSREGGVGGEPLQFAAQAPQSQAVELVCCCADAGDDAVDLQLLRALLTVLTASKLQVHSTALLLCVRSTYNVFLTSKSEVTQATAKATLIQIVNAVFFRIETGQFAVSLPPVTIDEVMRMGAGDEKASSMSTSASVHQFLSEVAAAVDPFGTAAATLQAELDEAFVPRKISDTGAGLAGEAEGAGGRPSWEGSLELPHSPMHSIMARASGRQSMENIQANAELVAMLEKDGFLLLRALCKLSIKSPDSSSDSTNSSKGRVLALELIKVILENSGHEVQSRDKILKGIKQYLCLSLLKCCGSSSAHLQNLCTSIFTTLLMKFRTKLKAEVGVFYPMILLKVLETPVGGASHDFSTPTLAMASADAMSKTAVLNCLERVSKDGQVLVDLFVNYDCDIEGGNLFERTIAATVRLAQGGHTSTGIDDLAEVRQMRFHALTFLTESVSSLREWHINATHGVAGDAPPGAKAKDGTASAEDPQEIPCPERDQDGSGESSVLDGIDESIKSKWMAQLAAGQRSIPQLTEGKQGDLVTLWKEFKKAFEKGVSLFNEKPKKGVEFLQGQKLVGEDPTDVAKFLAATMALDKAIIGDYLGERDDFNLSVMHAYVDALDFTDMEFDSAIRSFLSGFRLPGEAQKIDRLMEKFAERFLRCNPEAFKTADVAYVLAYSVIMLNTDAHNPMVKNKMTKEGFLKNNRGINDGGDLDKQFMEALYDRIVTNEIKMNDDTDDAGDVAQDGTESSQQPTGWFDSVMALLPGRQEATVTEPTDEIVRRTAEKLRTLAEGSSFVEAKDSDTLRPMVDVLWAPVLGAFSVLFESEQDQAFIDQSIDGFRESIILMARLRMTMLQNAFLTSLIRFTSLNAPGKIGFKNVKAFRTLLVLAEEIGDSLSDRWLEILRCVSRFELIASFGAGAPMDAFMNGSASGVRGTMHSPEELRLEASPSIDSMKLQVSSRASLANQTTGHSLRESAMPRSDTLKFMEMEDLTRFYLCSVKLSTESVIAFVQALCAVAIEELDPASTPRVFSLTQIVEIAHFNMGRIRIVWGRIWAQLSDFFVSVGCHENLGVGMYAVDSLRQLAIKFLNMDELANFNFQNDFLRPFIMLMRKSQNPEIRELVIRCVSQMVLARASNIKSGWKSVFMVLTSASSDKSAHIVRLAFSTVERIVREEFKFITETETTTFTDCVNCLVAFTNNPHSLDISLNAIAFLRFCAGELAEGDIQVQSAELPVDASASLSRAKEANRIRPVGSRNSGKPSAEAAAAAASAAAAIAAATPEPSLNRGTIRFTDRDEHMYFWFPLLVGLSELTFDPRSEVRYGALGVLFDILKLHGGSFTQAFWIRVYDSILLPMFDHVRAEVTDTTTFSDEARRAEADAWLYETCTTSLQYLVDVISAYHKAVPELLTKLLDLLGGFIRRNHPSLAAVGVAALTQLAVSCGSEAASGTWRAMLEAFKSATYDTIPDIEALLNMRSEHRRTSEDGNSWTLESGAGARRLAEIRCRASVQLLLAQACGELYAAHPQSMDVESLITILDLLEQICDRSVEVDGNMGLRESLALAQTADNVLEPKMLHDPPFLQLEVESSQAYMTVLLTINAVGKKEVIRDAAIGERICRVCLTNLERFERQSAACQAAHMESASSETLMVENVALVPLAVATLKALMGLPNDVFEKQARQLYPTLTNLIASEIAPQEVQNLLSDMFTSRISAMVE